MNATRYAAHTKFRYAVANPSSYAYLDNRRWKYKCGTCSCDGDECTCNAACDYTYATATLHEYSRTDSGFVCSSTYADDWGYGTNQSELSNFPYIQGLNVTAAIESYPSKDVLYMVGQNDTCNDNLPAEGCDSSCWQNPNSSGYNFCYRNDMDTRCPAMLGGPWRKARGQKYHDYLNTYYGRSVHELSVIDGCGHDATCIYSSDQAMNYIKGYWGN